MGTKGAKETKEIRPGITASGFRTAVRDYTEPTVVEELAANSYDADASTVIVLLDPTHRRLYIIDDGVGFSHDAIVEAATLGSGDKKDPYSKEGRPYLGSYGYGLKSTLNIANKVEIQSCSKDGVYQTVLDWSRLTEAIKPNFPGYKLTKKRKAKGSTCGTIINLSLKSPASKNHLDKFTDVLANLPDDSGKFTCYCGLYADAGKEILEATKKFKPIKSLAKKLYRNKRLKRASESRDVDLNNCIIKKIEDKNEDVKATIYFGGMEGGKVKAIKRGLRGIYVRIHGRLLKQSFTARKYTYNISKWVKFESGLRVELHVDWLRDQISLSREGVRFSNEKLESDFKAALNRLISRFIQPELKKISNKKVRHLNQKHKQRMELARKRRVKQKSVIVSGLTKGFCFKPECDAELALLLAQEKVLAKIDKNYILIDYNDQAPFDCIIHDKGRREEVFTELEPTLMDFLEHKNRTDIQLIIT
jgi:hypothetical protein